MRKGRVSRTALNVAASMVTLGAKRGWQERLPAGLPELSEALLLACGAFPFSPRVLELARRPWAVRLASLGERLQPGAFEGLGKRKIFMDRQVCAAIDAGATQVLVLGAGFDTLCLRLAAEYPRVRFFEIDHPDTARAKQRAVKQLGQPDNVTLLAADLAKKKLSNVLSECEDWDLSACSAFVAEGLLYYLSPEVVRQLFAEIHRSCGPGSRVAFSHLFDLHRYALARAALVVEGEPWLSASEPDELEDYVGAGWGIIETQPDSSVRELEGLAVAKHGGE
ncbi:MAG: SAM-dependent methyltransferase [Halieaceae bacterium]|jgi:methyltransferase (TIGR00027 family)|nr:SAM-dependent methyltransferase [Halieaceae bacterium]